jgi:hypothetical protein
MLRSIAKQCVSKHEAASADKFTQSALGLTALAASSFETLAALAPQDEAEEHTAIPPGPAAHEIVLRCDL